MKRIAILSVIFMLFVACQQKRKPLVLLKKEVFETEKAFALMASTEGIAKAFISFADKDAVIERNNELIQGKAFIADYYSKKDFTGMKLNWSPTFVEVSISGDLAYTYGSYSFTAPDKDGKMITETGIFHTIWKRQSDGNWKFVWD